MPNDILQVGPLHRGADHHSRRLVFRLVLLSWWFVIFAGDGGGLPLRQHGFAYVAFPAIVGDFVNTRGLRRDPSKHHLLAAPMTPQAFKRRHGIGCEWHNTPPRVSTGPYGAARLRITSHSSSEAEQTTCDPSRCPNRCNVKSAKSSKDSENVLGNVGYSLAKKSFEHSADNFYG